MRLGLVESECPTQTPWGFSFRLTEMAMTKKHLILIAAGPFVIAVTLGVLTILPPRPGVTNANFDRIEKGMTKAKVEQVFGGEGELPLSIQRGMTKAEVEQVFGREALKSVLDWKAADGSLAEIRFKNDCVSEKEWYDSEGTFLDKIRRWLHLP